MPLPANARQPRLAPIRGKAAPLLLALGVCLAVPATAATVYKWTDEDGTVHYSDAPPPGQQDVERLEIESGAPRPEVGQEQESEPDQEEDGGAADVNISEAEIQAKKLEDQVEKARQIYEQARENRIEGEKVRLGNEQNYVRYLERIEGLKEEEEQAKKQLEELRRKLEEARSRLQELRQKAQE
ncbi:DUF4124 domain-containing protein [Thiohalorhabdus denitrificans]|uniref:DUF4124 domain-containing protein n=1 Tax=Thiohalorhabdus denitrificans TaxID=381306 RepID=A0A1G5C892_9GAMM|nr:DUF4124 domain-containing protein [Thiohalorhabdus denitrificans]SCX98541.1 protein of unknown function [Thiohalorhabdus denitrificans]